MSALDKSQGLVRLCGETHVGLRSHNEDAFLIDEAIGLALVADGVGGHLAGEIASGITCETLAEGISAGSSLEQSIRAANLEVEKAGEDGRGNRGMASTAVALHFDGGAYTIAWVGDSRAYLWDGKLSLLTRDHSYVEALLSSGQISLDEARVHPKKNVIIQAIGLHADDDLEVGHNMGQLQAGELLLLCSDGLSDVLDSATLAKVLAGSGSLQSRCKRLVDTAADAGGSDNITAILVEGQAGLAKSPEGAEPEVVWKFDPANGEYHGLPGLTHRTQPIRSSSELLNSTPVMRSALVQEEVSAVRDLSRGKRRKVFLWIGLTAAVLAFLLSSLMIVGG